MVDSAIITVLDRSGQAIGDFELPVKIPVKELSQKLIASLKAMDSEKYMLLNHIGIEYNTKILNEKDSLYQNAIWDGSIIRLVY